MTTITMAASSGMWDDSVIYKISLEYKQNTGEPGYTGFPRCFVPLFLGENTFHPLVALT